MTNTQSSDKVEAPQLSKVRVDQWLRGLGMSACLAMVLAAAAALCIGAGGKALAEPTADEILDQQLCPVRLISPMEGATVTQRRVGDSKVETAYRFSWSACPDAKAYHLYVTHRDAANPIIDRDDLSTPSYSKTTTDFGATSLEGWTWKVRANVGGKWGQWSETRSFTLTAPLRATNAGTCTFRGGLIGAIRQQFRERPGGPLLNDVVQIAILSRTSQARVAIAFVDVTAKEYRSAEPLAEGTYTLRPNWRSEPRTADLECKPGGRHSTATFRITGGPLVD